VNPPGCPGGFAVPEGPCGMVTKIVNFAPESS
jgi:hypothetical protein